MTKKLRLEIGAAFLAATLLMGFSPATQAASRPKVIECTLMLDQKTGKTIIRDGTCDQQFTPMSTFKLPLALMGYDAGILKDEHNPTWAYDPKFDAPKRTRKPVDPAIWEKDSIVWFSQQLTLKLGEKPFADYIAKFDYGNKNVAGVPGGEDGLTHAWLSSSLKISPDEQARFVSRILARELPVSKTAYDMTRAIIPVFVTDDGWQVHGKTGSGWLRKKNGSNDRKRPIGWFVGWAEKDGRQIVFARMKIHVAPAATPLGLMLRDEFVKELPALMTGK